MTYLYGDATPFPLEENFIDTISAVTDCCVALFQLDVELADKRQEAREIAARCDGELNRLSSLARSLENALSGYMPKAESLFAAQSAAQQIAHNATDVVKQVRMSILRERDEGVRATTQLNLGPRMLDALAPFVLAHQLPKTGWYVRWRGSRQAGDANLAFTSHSACHLQLSFRADIPVDSRWQAPVRVDELMPSLRLTLQHQGGWIRRGPHAGKKAIHRFYVTQVETTDEHAWFELRQNPAKPSLGYEVILRADDPHNPIIYPINAGDERSEPLSLTGADAELMSELWDTIAGELLALTSHRKELLSARLRGTDVANLDEPGQLGEALLMALAPIVREIRVRSRVPGELVLKRDLGDGRREELFVPRQELEDKFAALPYEYQACFNAVGLGSEATSDFLRREFPLRDASEEAGDTTTMQRAPMIAQAHIVEDEDDDDGQYDGQYDSEFSGVIETDASAA